MKGFTNAINNSKDNIETLNITLKTNQQEHTDLVGVGFTLSYGNYTKSFTWEGSTMTIEVPAYVTYTITYEGVEDYKKPEDVNFTAHGGNSRSITALYQTELIDVALNSSDGSSVNGAVVLINGKSRTWDGNNIKQKVAFGTEYSVEPQSLNGFTTPIAKSFTAEQAVREVSFTYIASALKVNILSNQSTDSSWDPTITNVKAIVSYDGTSVEVSNGEQINLPSGVDVTISFPEVEGYLKPSDITFTHNGGLVEKSGTYQCELLTVNVSADQGSVSGFEVTISKQETVGVATKYTRLEYIESTGTQWIDTNVIGTFGMKMECKIAYPTISGNTYQCLLGSSYNYSRIEVGIRINGNKLGYNIDGSSFDYTNNEQPNVIYDYKFILNESTQQFYENDVLKVSSEKSSLIENNATMALFGCNNLDSSVVDRLTIARLYSCKIYNKEILVRDYIPALRSDGIAGLYDAVNDVFYPSNGTANFIYTTTEPTIVAKQTSVTGTYKIPYDNSYTISASSVSGYTTPQSVTRIANSKSYVIEQKYEIIKVKDLSLFDVYGNPIQRSTANCYVVREAGQYKFPVVYGNAIKNGKANTAAFTNNGNSNSHDFVNGYGFKILQPYINVDIDPIDVNCIVSNTDCSDTNISSLSIDDNWDYIQFTIVEVPSEGGNVIISICNGNEVFWSWHIWLWPHDLSPVEITNSTGVEYNIMPVNLASKYDADGVHIKNWFYQWGRPMPLLCPSAWNSTTDHTPGSITKASKAGFLDEGIAFPTKFYYNSSSPYNWFGIKSYYNLWDAACTGEGNSDNDTVKTVYDPCPVGWKIPNGNTFTGLSVLSSSNGIVKMRRYSGDIVGVGFPLSGYRDFSDGSFLYVGSIGYVWLSSANSQNYAYYLNFYSSNVSPQSYNSRALGFSVRPVQDDNISLDVIMISFTIDETAVGGSVVTYQAESGMTWFEWVNSEYNINGKYRISGMDVMMGDYLIGDYESMTTFKANENILGGHKYGIA